MKQEYTRIILLVAAVTALLISVACSSDVRESSSEGSVLTREAEPTPSSMPIIVSVPPDTAYNLVHDMDCRMPCWNGVVLGETTAEEAMISLEADERWSNIQVVRNSNPRDQGAPFPYINWMSADESLINGAMGFWAETGEVIEEIQLMLHDPVEVESLQKEFGNPSHVICYETMDTAIPAITIIYADVGFSILVEVNNLKQTVMDLQFSTITLFYPASLEGYREWVDFGSELPENLIEFKEGENLRYYCEKDWQS